MGKKCCVPNCKEGYKGAPKDPDVTFHLFNSEWKSKIHRGGNWEVTKNTFICSKHFVSTDFLSESQDSNNRRKKTGTQLKYRYLKSNAYPTLFPNCPVYLSKKKPAERTSLASSSARNEISAERNEEVTRFKTRHHYIFKKYMSKAGVQGIFNTGEPFFLQN